MNWDGQELRIKERSQKDTCSVSCRGAETSIRVAHFHDIIIVEISLRSPKG